MCRQHRMRWNTAASSVAERCNIPPMRTWRKRDVGCGRATAGAYTTIKLHKAVMHHSNTMHTWHSQPHIHIQTQNEMEIFHSYFCPLSLRLNISSYFLFFFLFFLMFAGQSLNSIRPHRMYTRKFAVAAIALACIALHQYILLFVLLHPHAFY